MNAKTFVMIWAAFWLFVVGFNMGESYAENKARLACEKNLDKVELE